MLTENYSKKQKTVYQQIFHAKTQVHKMRKAIHMQILSYVSYAVAVGIFLILGNYNFTT